MAVNIKHLFIRPKSNFVSLEQYNKARDELRDKLKEANDKIKELQQLADSYRSKFFTAASYSGIIMLRARLEAQAHAAIQLFHFRARDHPSDEDLQKILTLKLYGSLNCLFPTKDMVSKKKRMTDRHSWNESRLLKEQFFRVHLILNSKWVISLLNALGINCEHEKAHLHLDEMLKTCDKMLEVRNQAFRLANSSASTCSILSRSKSRSQLSYDGRSVAEYPFGNDLRSVVENTFEPIDFCNKNRDRFDPNISCPIERTRGNRHRSRGEDRFCSVRHRSRAEDRSRDDCSRSRSSERFHGGTRSLSSKRSYGRSRSRSSKRFHGRNRSRSKRSHNRSRSRQKHQRSNSGERLKDYNFSPPSKFPITPATLTHNPKYLALEACQFLCDVFSDKRPFEICPLMLQAILRCVNAPQSHGSASATYNEGKLYCRDYCQHLVFICLLASELEQLLSASCYFAHERSIENSLLRTLYLHREFFKVCISYDAKPELKLSTAAIVGPRQATAQSTQDHLKTLNSSGVGESAIPAEPVAGADEKIWTGYNLAFVAAVARRCGMSVRHFEAALTNADAMTESNVA